MTDLVLTLIGPDRPGLVESLAKRVTAHGGNWVESRMAHLAGQFAGILRVEVPPENVAALQAAVAELEKDGLRVVAQGGARPEAEGVRAMELEVVGQDHPGIVRDLSEVLLRHGVNIQELTTDHLSAPMAGGVLFSAKARLHVPTAVDADRLRVDLETIADDLMVDLSLLQAVIAGKEEVSRTGAAPVLGILAALALAGPAAGVAAEHPLRVSEDGRHLVEAGGQPFFYLGDTAWELFHRLDRDEARRYLEDRAAKGFTVIQAVVLAERDGLREPNPYGQLPLVDDDPRQPNPAYFEHVDFVVEQAEALGLTVGMLPTWGDKFHSRQHEPGPKVFDEANAGVFARFVGERYRDRGVLFILGGDRNPETEEDFAIVRAMGQALKAVAPGNLVTYHPRGPGRSSDFFHGEDWLDFNMIQSSHTGRGSDNAVNVTLDRALEPAKPTLDGEPRYEAIPIDFYMKGANPALRFDAADVRTAAYRPLLAGAAGHTYGNNNVWQMWSPKRQSVLWADTPWYEALDHPGAFQMGHLRRLFESRPWEKLAPDQGFVVSQNPAGGAFIRAAVAADRSFAFVHSPEGAPFVVDQGRLGAPELTYWWFDPRYGTAYEIHTGTGSGTQAFTPPASGPGRDWVLVIDDPREGFAPPGQAPGDE